jgi:hypothetical protein
MDGLIRLEVGKPYFYAAFVDETYLYVGFDEEDGHLFEEVAWRAPVRDAQDPERQLCFPCKVEGILDKARLIEWLTSEHASTSVSSTYEYETI